MSEVPLQERRKWGSGRRVESAQVQQEGLASSMSNAPTVAGLETSSECQ